MRTTAQRRLRIAIVAPFLVALSLVLWQVEGAGANAPQPNPLPSVSGVNIFANGPAASIHGNPAAGQALFVSQCASCHNDRGTGNLPNRGSDDGTVPSLNPIDPGFYASAGGDPAAFAREVDLFVQHGSRPAGPNPQLSMVPWGDQQMLTPQQIADVEAYVMQLSGVYWPDRWNPPAEIRGAATQSGNQITYQVTVVNQGGSTLGHLQMSDTLPAGLTYVSSYLIAGINPGQVTNSTVGWINDSGVPQGGTFGPFVVVAQTNQATPPPNVFQLAFNWTGPDGTLHTSTASSAPIVPGAAPASPAPAPSMPMSPASPTQVPSTAAATANVAAAQALLAKYGCGGCHVINGVPGMVGTDSPDLSHEGSAAKIPASTGNLANTPANLQSWIVDSPAVKPGTEMPNYTSAGMTQVEAQTIAGYLETLK
jgi:uncharacterized repeat protein (TIGR01451 family)